MGETATDAAGPRLSGFVDDFSSGRLQGWAVDRDGPDFETCILVLAGEAVVGACRADASRPDLVAPMPGEGRHGFDRASSDEAFEAADGAEVHAVTEDRRAEPARPWIDVVWALGARCGKIEGASEASPASRDIRTGPSGVAPRGGTADAGLILVDVRDLLAYHRAHVSVSGVQRVLCGLIDRSAPGESRP